MVTVTAAVLDRIVALKRIIVQMVLGGLWDPDVAGMASETTSTSIDDADAISGDGSTATSPPSSATARIGIRRRIFDFFNASLSGSGNTRHLSSVPSSLGCASSGYGLCASFPQRLFHLMSQMFIESSSSFENPSATGVSSRELKNKNSRLHFTSFSLLNITQQCSDAYNASLFRRSLRESATFCEYDVVSSTQDKFGRGTNHRHNGGSSKSRVPLFSLDRTQGTIRQLLQSRNSQTSSQMGTIVNTSSDSQFSQANQMLASTLGATQTAAAAGVVAAGCPRCAEPSRYRGHNSWCLHLLALLLLP